MSEVITLTGGQSETIHGTYNGAIAHIAMSYGSQYDAWTALSADNRKRCLASAVRYLNAQNWSDDYDTFAERDAVGAFATAQYELAVVIANDPDVVTQLDTGSNIQSVGAGGASVTYFAPTTGSYVLPPVVHRLVGSYLARSSSAVVSISSTGCETNSFNDDYDRNEP